MSSGTSARLLRLLSLLQSRPDWTGPELAGRLEVTGRTVRRDVDRLRSLGYPVEAVPGPAGGYRLGVGAALPPLLLDDTEAVAVAVGLRLAAAGGVGDLDTAAVAALGKLDRLLPARLRHRVEALAAATVTLTGAVPDVAVVDLVTLAQACRDAEQVRFRYRDARGRETDRTAEPFRLVHTGRRWYLLARDVDRDAWRTLRVDRIADPVRTGRRFTLDDEPDVGALMSRAIAVAPYRYQARVRVAAAAEEVARRVPPSAGLVEPIDTSTCLLISGSDDLDHLTGHLLLLGLPFEVLEPAELRRHVAERARDLLAAHDGPPDDPRDDPRDVSAGGPATGG